MQKELWDKVKAVNAGKLEISGEESVELVRDGYQMIIDDTDRIARLEGKADVFVAGGKALLGAGAIWFAAGKLSRYAARIIRDQYDPD